MPVRRRIPEGGCARLAAAMAGAGGGGHGPAGPQGAVQGRGAQRPAVRAGRPAGREGCPRPPRTDRRQGHCRRAACPFRAAWLIGRAQPFRVAGRQPGRLRPNDGASAGWPTTLPTAPGVYLFRGPGDEVLYVGTSGNLHQRVRSYFSAAETRTRIKHMVALAERVDHVECAHALEAHIREQRLIAVHQPPYNRRSRQARRGVLGDRSPTSAFPRLSIVRTRRNDRELPWAVSLQAGCPDRGRGVAGRSTDRRCTARIRRHRSGRQSVRPGRTRTMRARPARSGGRGLLRPARSTGSGR